MSVLQIKGILSINVQVDMCKLAFNNISGTAKPAATDRES